MTAEDERRARDALLDLPGVERVLWSGPELESGGSGRPTVVDDRARVWMRLLAATAAQMSAELGHGPPRLLTMSYDDRVVALAVDHRGTIVAVISSDPSAVGLAMVKLRRWLTIRLRSEE